MDQTRFLKLGNFGVDEGGVGWWRANWGARGRWTKCVYLEGGDPSGFAEIVQREGEGSEVVVDCLKVMGSVVFCEVSSYELGVGF